MFMEQQKKSNWGSVIDNTAPGSEEGSNARLIGKDSTES